MFYYVISHPKSESNRTLDTLVNVFCRVRDAERWAGSANMNADGLFSYYVLNEDEYLNDFPSASGGAEFGDSE